MPHTFVGTYRHHDRSGATIVRFSLSTDFAARTDEARVAADWVAMLAHGAQAVTTPEVAAASHPNGGTVAEFLAGVSKSLGEPMTILGAVRMDKDGVAVDGAVRHPMECPNTTIADLRELLEFKRQEVAGLSRDLQRALSRTV